MKLSRQRSLSQQGSGRSLWDDIDDMDGGDPMQPLEGLLYKYTNVMKGWQYRWFVLDPEIGCLMYFEKEEHRKGRPRGSVQLAGAVISPSDEDSQTFGVNAANGEIYRLRAIDAKERQHWVNRLRATSEHHTATLAQNNPPIPKDGRPHTLAPPVSLATSSANSGSLDSLTTTSTTRAATKVLTPTGKTKHEKHVQKSHASGGAKGPVVVTRRSHHKGSGSAQNSETFRDVREMLSQVQNNQLELSAHIEELPPGGEQISSLDKDMLLLKATSSATLACLEQCLSILQQQQLSPVSTSQGNGIEWLDPKAIPGAYGGRTISCPVSPAESFVSASDIPIGELRPSNVPNDVTIDPSEEVEDDSEYTDTDLRGVEEHKSIILHLLSQLKLGMDLTKVVLPTFILEKRSLLEMFADCMAHPDQFVKITEQPDPESRMMAVVEWYLTSFHAGRQVGTETGGSIAKKPYNPIIGETFHCSWHVPNSQSQSNDFQSDQSQPSTTQNDLSGSSDTGQIPNGQLEDFSDEGVRMRYSAEQVSHHPPISAFYFECPEKQVFMNASIWTKSKFMGMSIGVVMVGKIHLRLLEHKEEYEFTLPSAYARSILTIPWVELGDRVNITCQRTGYNATVTFHTKPFYGGKLHKVSSEVRSPTDEVVCKVQGEWNGAMEFTYANGETKTVDVTKSSTRLKCVRPLAAQGELESRRLWRNVTEALKKNDINAATEHKRFLEERQRQAERFRKEHNQQYPTKLFHKQGDMWVYNNLLQRRPEIVTIET